MKLLLIEMRKFRFKGSQMNARAEYNWVIWRGKTPIASVFPLEY